MASDTIKTFGTSDAAQDVLIGVVGEGAAMEFIGFISQTLTGEKCDAILADPDRAELPTKVSELYALIAYASSKAKDDGVAAAAGRLLNRLKPELAVIMMRLILRLRPQFSADPGFIRFVQTHRTLLS